MKNQLLSTLFAAGALLSFHATSYSIEHGQGLEKGGLEKGDMIALEENEVSILPAPVADDTQSTIQPSLPEECDRNGNSMWTNPLLPDLPENDGRNIRLNLDGHENAAYND